MASGHWPYVEPLNHSVSVIGIWSSDSAPHSVGPHAIGRMLVDIPFDATHQFLTDRMIDLLACNDHDPDKPTDKTHCFAY